MTEKAKTQQKSRTYLVLIAFSLTYMGIYYLLMRETEACDPQKFFIRNHWFHGFWDQYLACRSINELGDALAGAFAPVAFIWLAGTVFIQSQELQAQRQELDETQEVMREQLEVSREQVKETKASTKLFERQTAILEYEHNLREQAASDDALKLAVAALPMKLQHVAIKYWKYETRPETDQATFLLWQRFREPHDPPGMQSTEETKWFRMEYGEQFGIAPSSEEQMHPTFSAAIRQINALCTDKTIIEFMDWSSCKAELRENKRCLDEVVGFAEKASLGMKYRINALRIAEVSSKLSDFIDFAERIDVQNQKKRAEEKLQ